MLLEINYNSLKLIKKEKLIEINDLFLFKIYLKQKNLI